MNQLALCLHSVKLSYTLLGSLVRPVDDDIPPPNGTAEF